MKKFLVLCWLSLFIFPLYGQNGGIDRINYRLVKTWTHANFDNLKLDKYFRDKALLDKLGAKALSIFEPKKGYYTIYQFLGDSINESGLHSTSHSISSILPLALQKVLVLKVNESMTIVDGYLMPYKNKDVLLSNNLFRVRTLNMQLKENLSFEELNFRNLYDKSKRAEGGNVLTGSLLSNYKEVTKPEDVVYRLVKRVEGADFKKSTFMDFEEAAAKFKIGNEGILALFEPLDGDYVYYQFIADVVGEVDLIPEGEFGDHDRYFANSLESFESTIDKTPYLIKYNLLLILKTDRAGIILDGYQFDLSRKERPFKDVLYRVSRHGLQLRDNMDIKELGFIVDRGTDSGSCFDDLDDVGRISFESK